MPGPETLEIGREPHLSRWPLGRRARLTVAGLVVAAVAVAWVLQGQVRAREQRAVEACATRAAFAMQQAQQQLSSVAGFVRPVLDSGARGPLRQQMFRIVSEGVAGADLPLEEVRRECGSVVVAALHGGIEERRDRCTQRLARHAAYLRAVAADGAAILAWPSLPTTC